MRKRIEEGRGENGSKRGRQAGRGREGQVVRSKARSMEGRVLKAGAMDHEE